MSKKKHTSFKKEYVVILSASDGCKETEYTDLILVALWSSSKQGKGWHCGKTALSLGGF